MSKINPTLLLPWKMTDGGREAAGFTKKNVGDCVTRAIAIATGQPYRQVYDYMWQEMDGDSRKNYRGASKSPDYGVNDRIYRPYLEGMGWKRIRLGKIFGTKHVYLRKNHVPLKGTFIIKVGHHLCALVDGVIHDNRNCGEKGSVAIKSLYYNTNDLETARMVESFPAFQVKANFKSR